jgi:phosphonate C-P lyase system protein PhnH
LNGPAEKTNRYRRLDPLVGQMSTEVFRALLRTISRPGTIEIVRPAGAARLLYGDALATLAIPALALANVDVKLSALGGVPSSLVLDIAAATDAAVTRVEDADLVLADRFVRPEELRLLRTGTATDPHLSSRLCMQVDELCEIRRTNLGADHDNNREGHDNNGADHDNDDHDNDDHYELDEFDVVTAAIADPSGLDPVTIELQGPGIRGSVLRRVHGLATSVLESIVDLNRSFPVGVDTHLISRHGELMSIPRTTRLRVIPVVPMQAMKRAGCATTQLAMKQKGS